MVAQAIPAAMVLLQSMFCKIADLVTDIPKAGDLVPRCQEYLCKTESNIGADITIRTDLLFRKEDWPGMTDDQVVYMESGTQFHLELLKLDGIVLHSSAVALDGKAYLFSAPCGTGKSTHTRQWQSIFGEGAKVFNDDKPALRLINGVWYAYGTPWCGKDGININMKVPLAGICFLKQAPENKIRRLSQTEAMQKVIWQTGHKFRQVENLDLMLSHVDKLVRMIPVYELECLPDADAARLSYETMRRGAEEMGL